LKVTTRKMQDKKLADGIKQRRQQTFIGARAFRVRL
jgi:hypothetical protein